jgi:hypothetical protein
LIIHIHVLHLNFWFYHMFQSRIFSYWRVGPFYLGSLAKAVYPEGALDSYPSSPQLLEETSRPTC